MNRSQIAIRSVTILAVCAIISITQAEEISTPSEMSVNTPLSNHATGQQLWLRIKQIIALKHGYLTKEDIERVLGYKLTTVNQDVAAYDARNPIISDMNYAVSVHAATHASRHKFEYKTSQVRFEFPKSDCVSLLQVRQEMNNAGIRRYMILGGKWNPRLLPPSPSEYYGNIDSRQGAIEVMLNAKNKDQIYSHTVEINDIEAAGYCVSSFRIDGQRNP